MGRKDMVSSSAPRGRMCLYTSPRFRRTATVRSTRAKPWSLICSKAPKASRRQTLCAHKPVGEAIHQPSRTQREGFVLGRESSRGTGNLPSGQDSGRRLLLNAGGEETWCAMAMVCKLFDEMFLGRVDAENDANRSLFCSLAERGARAHAESKLRCR